MVACLSIPGLELKAALAARPSLALRPAALAPAPGASSGRASSGRASSGRGESLLGPVTAAAETAGVRPGMRLGEALATCPQLELVEPDPAAVELAWERIAGHAS